MAKLSPEERWRRHVLERITALKLSEELRLLRARGLSLMGRKRLYRGQQWHQDF